MIRGNEMMIRDHGTMIYLYFFMNELVVREWGIADVHVLLGCITGKMLPE